MRGEETGRAQKSECGSLICMLSHCLGYPIQERPLQICLSGNICRNHRLVHAEWGWTTQSGIQRACSVAERDESNVNTNILHEVEVWGYM